MKTGAVMWRPVWEGVAIPQTQCSRTNHALARLQVLTEKLRAKGFQAQTYSMPREGGLAYGVRIKGRRADMLKAQALCPSRGRVVTPWMPRAIRIQRIGPGEIEIDF